MNVMTGFAQGFQQRGDELSRRRREIAQAFNEFRQTNPDATLREMQDFIDAQSGGENYLRGGAPSNDVLRQIADRNAEQARQRATRAALEDARNRNAFRGELSAAIDTHLLDMPDDNFDNAYSSFVGDYGQGDDSIFEGLNVRSMFTNERRTRIERQHANDENMITQAMQLIEAAPDTIDAPLVAQEIGVNRRVAQALIDAARRRLEEQEQERQRAAGRQAQEDRNRALGNIRQAYDAATARPAVQALIRNGQTDEAANAVLREMRRWAAPEEFQLVYGVDINSADPNALFREDLIAEQSLGQTSQQYERSDLFRQTRDALPARIEQTRAQSIAMATERHEPNTDIGGITSSLASRYVWSDELSRITEDVIDSEEGRALIEENRRDLLDDMVQSDPRFVAASAGRDMETRTRERADRLFEINNPPIQRFDAYVNDVLNARNELGATATSEIEQIRALAESDPALARTQINILRQDVAEWAEDQEAELGLRANDGSWVEVGSQYRPERLRPLMEDTRNAAQSILRRLEQLEQNLPEPEPRNTSRYPTSIQELMDMNGADVAERNADRRARNAIRPQIAAAVDAIRPVPWHRSEQFREAGPGEQWGDTFREYSIRRERSLQDLRDYEDAIIGYIMSQPESERPALIEEARLNPIEFVGSHNLIDGPTTRYPQVGSQRQDDR